MRRFLILLAVGAVALAGCSSEDAASDDAAGVTAEAQQKVDAAQTNTAEGDHVMEVACAHCVYHMDGVNACAAAVKVNDKPVLLTGVPVDPVAVGLCGGPKQAHIHGSVQDGKFVASAVRFE